MPSDGVTSNLSKLTFKGSSERANDFGDVGYHSFTMMCQYFFALAKGTFLGHSPEDD